MTPQERKLRNARARVVQAHPFFGALLLRQKVVETSDVETMATDGKNLFFNPAFVDKILPAELLGVIAHEALHPALGHQLRRGGRDHRQWNEACDYAINPILVRAGFTLPASALIDARFDGKGAEAIYPMLGQPRSNAKDAQDGAEGAGSSRGQGMPRPGDGSGRQVPSFGGTGAVIDAPVRDEADRATQEAEWHVALAQAVAAAGAGNVDGQLRAAIEAELSPRVDWRDLLRRYVQQLAKDDYTWSAPNRRFIADGLYLPSMRSERLAPALFVVDASGSMSDEALQHALSNARPLLEDCGIERLDVAVHDTRITSTHSFEPGDVCKVDVLGRGGTKFAPVCDYIDAMDERPSVVIWFTDLEASDWGNTHEPDAPVLWLQYGGGDFTPPFGDDVVRFEQ